MLTLANNNYKYYACVGTPRCVFTQRKSNRIMIITVHYM